MSTITTINASDAPKDSRAVINTNFSNLNTDKIETSVLSTSGTLTENSDSRVATQKATKTYVDTQVAANAVPTCLTLIPKPTFSGGTQDITSVQVTGNTTGFIYQIPIPFKITVNKISFRTNSVSVAGTYKISLYSENGQTQLFSVTTASVSASSTIYTTAVSSVVVSPGNYYLMIQAVSTANASMYAWITYTPPFGTVEGLHSDVTSEPVLGGTYTVTADTAPSTITPTSLLESASAYALIVRLDN